MTTRDEDEVSSDDEDSGKVSDDEDCTTDELEACFLEDDEDFALFEELERSILNHSPSIHW